MARMKAPETFKPFQIDHTWSPKCPPLGQTGLILAKRAAIIMSVWLTLDNVTERSSALRVHSARRPLLLRQSKLGEILQTSDTQSFFCVNCSKEGFSALQQKWFLGTCEFLWYKVGAGYSCILQSSWSMAFPLWSKHQMAAVLQNLQWIVMDATFGTWYLVLGTWYFCRTCSGKYLYATLGGSLARGICPASASRQFHGQSEESARAALIFHNLSQRVEIMRSSYIPLLWHKTL